MPLTWVLLAYVDHDQRERLSGSGSDAKALEPSLQAERVNKRGFFGGFVFPVNNEGVGGRRVWGGADLA